MNLFEQIVRFNSLVNKLETKISKLAQMRDDEATIQPFPAGSGQGGNSPMIQQPQSAGNDTPIMSGKLAPSDGKAFPEEWESLTAWQKAQPENQKQNYGDPATVKLLQTFLNNSLTQGGLDKHLCRQ